MENVTISGGVDIYRLNLLSKIINVIEEDNLFERADKTGEYFKNGAKQIMKNNRVFSDIRGKGNFLAFNLPNSDLRNKFISHARNKGLFVIGCGEHSIRLRPSLTIHEKDYDFLLNEMESFRI